MALDLGEKRIGVAVGDDATAMAFPERVLRRQSAKADRQTIARLVKELGVGRVVVGLPLSMEGEVGPNAARARSFSEYLQRVLPVPVDLWDERLTTVEAEERLREAGVPPEQRRARIDAAAAAIILEDYMRAHSSGS